MNKASFQVEGVVNSLWNEDSAPIEQENRTWNAANLVSVWAAIAVSLPAYLCASCLAALGVSVSALLLSALVGSVLVAGLAFACGHTGVRYGIPFAVLARIAFGVVGARVPVALRLLVLCAFVGIGYWLGAEALWYALLLLGLPMPGWGTAACFAVILLGVGVSGKGKRYRIASALCAAGLLLFLVVAMPLELQGRGWTFFHIDPLLPVHPTLPVGQGMLLGVTAFLGLWLPVALGAADGARRIRSHSVHLWSVSTTVPASLLFFGVVAVTARMLGGGDANWSPLMLGDGVARFSLTIGSLLTVVVVALLSARSACAWLAGEIAATVPGRVSVPAATRIVGVAAALSMPWRWVASPERYIGEWLTGCAGLLAPVAAILLVEYFGLRRRWLNVDDLYQRDGLYEYSGGWNWKAFGAVAAGWMVMIFIIAAPSFAGWRGGAVWIGTGVSGAVYWLLRTGPPDVARISPTPLLIPLVTFETEGASG